MEKKKSNGKIRKWLSTPLVRIFIAIPVTVIIFLIADTYLKNGFLFLSHAELLLIIWGILTCIYMSLIIEWFLHYRERISPKVQKWFRLRATPKILEFMFFVGIFMATLMGAKNIVGFTAVYGISLACGFYHYILRVDDDTPSQASKPTKRKKDSV